MKIQKLTLIAVICTVAGIAAGCGNSGSAENPTPVEPPPVAATPPPPAPAESPDTPPAPPPCNECEPPVTNTKPPVRLTLRVYKVQDINGTLVEGIPPAIPIGYTVTVDATPKDENNRDTLGSGTVEFSFSDPDLVEVGSNHGFQKKLKVLGAGLLEVKGFLDGIESNTLVITLG